MADGKYFSTTKKGAQTWGGARPSWSPPRPAPAPGVASTAG